MADSLRNRLGELQGKRPVMASAGLRIKGEATRRNPAISDAQRFAGHVFGSALHAVELTKEEAGHELNYADGTSVTRWTSGVDVPEFLARFIAHPMLRGALVEALAKIPGDHVHGEFVVRIARCDARRRA